MVNITGKSNSLRKAVATAIVTVSSATTIRAIRAGKVPKGDVFEFSRAAGLLAIKKTSDVIPDCHPLPVEYAAISHEMSGQKITITVEVHTIYKTGVEVEAMHGAAITALTMYDMLKPIDKDVRISEVKLEHKSGGKTDIKIDAAKLKAAVVVCSDTIAAGRGEDKAGKAVMDRLRQLRVRSVKYLVVPDDKASIAAAVKHFSGKKTDILLFTGGTGLSKKDLTPDVVAPLLTQPIEGIMETARRYGQERMPYAMLSRGVAGFIEDTLVITLPGSLKGAMETMDAIFPQVLHLFQVRESAYRH